ncbi:hypothetical protein ISCGN_020116 [Ixodes scapularis]
MGREEGTKGESKTIRPPSPTLCTRSARSVGAVCKAPFFFFAFFFIFYFECWGGWGFAVFCLSFRLKRVASRRLVSAFRLGLRAIVQSTVTRRVIDRYVGHCFNCEETQGDRHGHEICNPSGAERRGEKRRTVQEIWLIEVHHFDDRQGKGEDHGSNEHEW